MSQSVKVESPTESNAPLHLHNSTRRTSSAELLRAKNNESLWTRLYGPPAKKAPGWISREIPQLVGEFCGTFLFLFLAYIVAQAVLSNDPSVAAGNSMEPATLLIIACGFGLGLLVSLWLFKGISGEMFNPAITIGLVLTRAVTPLQGLMHIPVQLVAAIAAAGLVDAITPGPLLVGNKLAPDVSPARGLFIEAFLTTQLVLTVFMLTRPSNPHPAAHVGIAISVLIGHLAGIDLTGTGINPARSLGPDVVSAQFPSSAWVYYAGPVMGAFFAFAIFTVVRYLESNKQNRASDLLAPNPQDPQAQAQAPRVSPV